MANFLNMHNDTCSLQCEEAHSKWCSEGKVSQHGRLFGSVQVFSKKPIKAGHGIDIQKEMAHARRLFAKTKRNQALVALLETC